MNYHQLKRLGFIFIGYASYSKKEYFTNQEAWGPDS